MEVESVRGSESELGLFATRSYKRFDQVHVLSGVELDHPTRESIYVGGGVHIVDAWGQFVNHSFEPSCTVRGRFFIALRDINVGEELTFNYNWSELPMANPFRTSDGRLVNGNIRADEEHSKTIE